MQVRAISLFGEVWGIGPATALKLYEKGYRTLDDLKNDDSLTYAQKLGLKYFHDIRTRIPRNEVSFGLDSLSIYIFRLLASQILTLVLACRFKKWNNLCRKLGKRYCLGWETINFWAELVIKEIKRLQGVSWVIGVLDSSIQGNNRLRGESATDIRFKL